MTHEPCGAMQFLLQADLDGELDVTGAAALASHLTNCDACSVLKVKLEAQSAQLRDNTSRYTAPASLRASVLARSLPAQLPLFRRLGRGWGHGVSFGAGMAVAASLATFVLLPHRSDNVPDIVAAHIRALQPGHLLDVMSTDRHTVKPWFDGRLDYAPPVADFAAGGFPLIGGRLDYVAGRPVAALVYRHDKHLIDVFVWPGDRTDPTETVQGYHVIGWTQGGMTYRAVSDLATADLARFAMLMQGS